VAPLGYRKRLEADLVRWAEAGHVSPQGQRAILADVAARYQNLGIAPVLAVLGAVLLCFGVMLFVASNWQDMPRIARLGVLVAGLWAAYATAGWFHARRQPAFAEAATLFGVGLFGAAIMLVGQLYNLSSDPAAGVLLWLGGAALAAGLLRSKAATVAAVALAGLWTTLELNQTNEPHWWFLAVWAALFALQWLTLRWRPGLHLTAMLLAYWLIALGYVLNGGQGHEVVAIIGLAVLGLSLLGGPAIDQGMGTHDGALSRPAAAYGLTVAFAGLFAMQFIDWSGFSYATPWMAANGMPLAFLAAFALAVLLASAWVGVQRNMPALTWLAYIGFSLEIVALYFRTLGTLLDTSLFFLVAGGLVCALAALAWWLHGRAAAEGAVT
jgi:uncharacterized membrane protein